MNDSKTTAANYTDYAPPCCFVIALAVRGSALARRGEGSDVPIVRSWMLDVPS